MNLVAGALLVGLAASTGPGQFAPIYQAGLAKQRAGQYAEARKDFEEALALAARVVDKADARLGIAATHDAQRNYSLARAEFSKVLLLQGATPDQKARAQLGIGSAYLGERNFELARRESEKVLAMPESPAARTAEAQLLIGHSCRGDYERKLGEARRMGVRSIVAFAKVADVPGIAAGQKADAQMAIANLQLAMKNYSDARAELARLLDVKDLTPGFKAMVRVQIGKSYFLERNYAAARKELAKALCMKGLSAVDKADAQLHIGLTYYDAADYQRARPELEKVLSISGAREQQTHEATLRLHLRKLISTKEKVLTVLFIGASHTQVWDVPRIVEVLAASAPPGRPRVLAGRFLRGGTGIDSFWEEGAGPETARGKVAAEPWDCVVFETHPVLFGHDSFVRYATQFAELIGKSSGKPVLFEAPAFLRSSYPADFQQNHDDNLALARKLGCVVAPAGFAWMKYLGPTPTPGQRMALYHPDAVHPSKKGAYMLACSLYCAITGSSCRGLTHSIPTFAPEGISKDDAAALQEAAWEAFRGANPTREHSP